MRGGVGFLCFPSPRFSGTQKKCIKPLEKQIKILYNINAVFYGCKFLIEGMCPV